jgi:hypothetical protein
MPTHNNCCILLTNLKKQEEYQKEVNAKQKELEAEQKKLEGKKTVLAADAFEKEMKKGGIGLMNSIQKLISNNNSKNNSKITYIKASESLKYQKK